MLRRIVPGREKQPPAKMKNKRKPGAFSTVTSGFVRVC
jgi:hypothetical protein